MVVALIVLLGVGLAVRSMVRNRRAGGCPGCDGCGNCPRAAQRQDEHE
ncbi:MAG: FeoB-associated Cys-rich membrane protein [Oscillospiraceae bacterium]|nr:FeoB-associated Cys-rich membrane protein [Oscillospiraceae bacterium]